MDKNSKNLMCTTKSNKFTHISDIIVSYYNSEKTLKRCLDTLIPFLNYDRRLIILDDGSTDLSYEIARNILTNVNKDLYTHIKKTENMGLTKALNYMINMSTADLIFRIDSDDRVIRGRFEIQEKYMLERPYVGVLGSQVKYIKNNRISKKPLNTHEICKKIHTNPIVHPSTCFRRLSIKSIGGYDESFRSGQDHNLWYRCIDNGIIINNLPNVLVELGPTLAIKYSPRELIKEYIGCLIQEIDKRRNNAIIYLTLRIVVLLPLSHIYNTYKRIK